MAHLAQCIHIVNTILLISFKGIACSNDTAKVLSQMEPAPRKAFLVGSVSNIKPIEDDDCRKIAELLGISPLEVPVASFSI